MLGAENSSFSVQSRDQKSVTATRQVKANEKGEVLVKVVIPESSRLILSGFKIESVQ